MTTRAKLLAEKLRAQADRLLEAVRDIPFWNGEPGAKEQDWWHRKNKTGQCTYSGCNRTPCYCDPDTDMAMGGRLRSVQTAHEKAMAVLNRYRREFDDADLKIAGLLQNPWVPNSNRDQIIEILQGSPKVAAGSDPKEAAILAALVEPAQSLAEIAARTRDPRVSLSTVKKLSKALQDSDLIRRNEAGNWELV